MRRSLGRIIFAFIVFPGLVGTAYPRPQTTPPSNQKVIKDVAEYNAYMAALNTQDPSARAAAMEAFFAQYPNTVMKIETLEQAMAAYQLANNAAKVQRTAGRILELEPNSVRALGIVVFLDRSAATAGGPAAASALEEGCSGAQRGLQLLPGWQKPESVSDADFQKLRDQFADIFNGASGFCALQKKDYAHARDYYLKALLLDPASLQDTYQLAVTCLEMNPVDVNGFWYIARASQLAANNPQAQNSIVSYGKAKYRRYHGQDDGWDQLLASAAAAAQAAPPAGLARTIKPRSAPAELAVIAVKENKPGKLSISDWEYILSYRDASPANEDAAGIVWKWIQDSNSLGRKMQIPVKIISSTSETITAAITDENQEANKVDLEITMEKPMSHPPAAGSFVNITGYITDYKLSPFLFLMKQGEQDLFNENVKDIHFDFGKDGLRLESRQTLTHAARVIAENPDWIVQIEGNCDERESSGYPGIALKRAEAAREALIQAGVNLSQLKTVGNGAGKPVCREAGDDCEQQNRRDHFVLLPKS